MGVLTTRRIPTKTTLTIAASRVTASDVTIADEL